MESFLFLEKRPISNLQTWLFHELSLRGDIVLNDALVFSLYMLPGITNWEDVQTGFFGMYTLLVNPGVGRKLTVPKDAPALPRSYHTCLSLNQTWAGHSWLCLVFLSKYPFLA